MAAVEGLKDLVKPPFANYDIVVYFGCGFFALPFIFHYIAKPTASAITPEFGMSSFVATVAATFTMLFAIYALGHFIAYLGSELIEKTADALFGKTSYAIAHKHTGTEAANTAAFQQTISSGIAASISPTNLPRLVRFILHSPMLPWYALIYKLKLFGFYKTRVPLVVFDKAHEKLQSLPGTTSSIGNAGLPWFKILEAHVINNHPLATARMYNYLIISGLFRSVAVIFLGALWVETLQSIWLWIGYAPSAGLMILDNKIIEPHYLAYFIFSAGVVFTTFSYLKFQRRYVEDAIFAFVYVAP